MRNHPLIAYWLFLAIALGSGSGSLQADFELDWFSFDGGSGTSEGGTYTLTGTVGQPDAATLSGGGFSLEGGFLAAQTVVPSGEAPPLTLTVTNGTLVLMWSASPTGYELQESASLEETDWHTVIGTPEQIGDGKRFEIPLTPGHHFYRLSKP